MRKDGQEEIHEEIIPFFFDESALDRLAFESLLPLPPPVFLFPENLDEDPEALSVLREGDLERDLSLLESDLESLFL